MKHVLRGTHGRHAGSVFVIDGPLILGRAPHADVQILEEGVSRQHARIRVEPDGRLVIADLQSGMGTKVGGRRIDKKELRPGETVQIGEARFVYETREGEPITSPSFVEKSSSAEAMHRTNPGVKVGVAQARAPGVTSGAAGIYHPGSGGAVPAVRPTGTPPPQRPKPAHASAAPVEPQAEPQRPIGHGLSAGAPRAPIGWDEANVEHAGPGLPTIDLGQGVAELAHMFSEAMADASEDRFSVEHGAEEPTQPAAGPTLSSPDFCRLMEQILHYHDLAAELTRQGAVDPEVRDSLAAYEAGFRQGTQRSEDRRQWRRFPVRAAAQAVWFRDLRSRSVSIALLDISASGVCFEPGERVFDLGDVVSLLISIPAMNKRQAVFSARITWVAHDGDRCGATFVGPGSWQGG